MIFTREIIRKFKLGEYNLCKWQFEKLHFMASLDTDSKIFESLNSLCIGLEDGYISNPKTSSTADNDTSKTNIDRNILVIFDEKFNTDNLAGFIVVEKGECKKLPNVYSIRLFYSKINKCSLLIAAALYALKTNPMIKDKRCILEVANEYKDTPAYSMYSKFGFKPAPELYGKKGFNDYSNFPMIVNLNNISVDTIKNAATDPVEVDVDNLLYPRSTQKQYYISINKTLKMVKATNYLPFTFISS